MVLHQARRAAAAIGVLGISLAAHGDSADLTVSAATATVTGSATQTMNFPVARGGDASYNVRFLAETVDGSAKAGVHYTAGGAVLTLAAGATSIGVPVTITGNSTNPPDKTFSLSLRRAFGFGPAPAFGAAQSLATGSLPLAVIAADFSGDGKPDLAAANALNDDVSVWLNTTAPGAGTATFGSRYSFGTGDHPFGLASADFNRDGSPDLAIPNYYAASVSVLLNATGVATVPSFLAQESFATGTNPNGVAAADLNGDGSPDLAVANFNDSTVSVLLNTTAPGAATVTFTAQQTFATAGKATSVAAADLNGDGKPELVVSNYLDGTVSVLRNTMAAGAASASFATQQELFADIAIQVAAEDLTGDGLADLVVATGSYSLELLVNGTLPGASTFTFTDWPFYQTGAGSRAVTTADVNGDGKPDLLAANGFDDTLSVLVNSTFPGSSIVDTEPQQTYATQDRPTAIATADLNLDGRPDVVTANADSNTLSLLLNTTAVGTVGVSLATQQALAAGTGSGGADVADFTGDGKRDIVVASQIANTVSVMRNATNVSTGAMSFASQQAFATGVAPRSARAIDVNGDGRPDIVTPNQGATTVSVLLNTGVPGGVAAFATQKPFIVGENPAAVVGLDVNLDGKADLATANLGTDNVSVLLNTTTPGAATPTFAAQQSFAVGTDPYTLAAGDLNGDGRSDLVAANDIGDSVSVLINTTVAGAAVPVFAAQQVFAVGNGASAVAVADFNNDGKPDLLVTDQLDDTLSVLLNTTTLGSQTASFAARQTTATGDYPRAVGAADLNGDGRLDALVTNGIDSTVQFILNATVPGSSTVAFGDSQSTGPLSNPDSVLAADVDGDERPDLVVGASEMAAVVRNNQYRVTLGAPATGTIHYAYVPPPAPANLTAAAGNAQVTLTWTASSGATAYNVYVGTAPGVSTATPFATFTNTQATVTNLVNGTAYYFVVKAVRDGGTSASSGEVSATPVAPPVAPPAGGGEDGSGGGAWGGVSLLVMALGALVRRRTAAISLPPVARAFPSAGTPRRARAR